MTTAHFNRLFASLFVLGSLVMIGCKSYGVLGGRDSSEITPAVQTAPEPIRIIYRTKTDRLNVAGANLPPCSMATLQIQVPHPHHKVNAGLARLTTSPCTIDPELTPKNLAEAVGQASNVWEDDIPLWQLTTIVAQLESANFFRRAKVFGPACFLSVDAGDLRHGRPYHDVPELDAMISRISNASSERSASSASRDLARLPRVNAR